MSENPVLEIMRVFFAGTGWQEVPEVPPTRTYTRDDMVRAILAQQWAVAIALHRGLGWCQYVSDLPCAHDVVEGMEQS